MRDKAVSGIILTLLLIGILPSVFDIQPVEAEPGTIYIRADGSIDPLTANITTVDKETYYFTANNYDSIVIERDNIVVDGASFTLQGPGSIWGGMKLDGRSNVTIKNMNIDQFHEGVFLNSSCNNIIFGNNITNSADCGVLLYSSSHNNTVFENDILNADIGIALLESHNMSIYGNSIRETTLCGIYLFISSDNIIYRNVITNNIVTFETRGFFLASSSNNNTLFRNTIANYEQGIRLYASNDNKFWHNNLIGNTDQVYVQITPVTNYWDDGYPSGGNYWSDNAGLDVKSGPNQDQSGSDGIGDTQYVINGNNQDNYPLMQPWTPTEINVEVDGTDYPVTIVSNSTITNFNFSYSLQKLSFEVAGPSNTTGYCNIILPEDLINGTIAVLVNGIATAYNIEENTTHFFIYFTYSHSTSFVETLATVLGDVDGDRDVDVGDQRKVQLAMFSVPGDPNWNLYADVDCDEDVDVGDQRKQQLHMFESW